MEFTLGDQLTYLVHDSEGDKVAHCLDLDLVGTGTNTREAIDALNTLVIATILFAIKSESLEAITHSAPERYWKKFQAASEESGSKISRLDIPDTTRFSINECHYTYRWAVAA